MESEGVTWAYTTVQTLLNRLETKGYVKRDTSGSAHTYRPTTSRDKLLSQRLHELADQLCEGTATPLVMALVDSARFTRNDIARFRQLLDELEQSAPEDEDNEGSSRSGSSIAE